MYAHAGATSQGSDMMGEMAKIPVHKALDQVEEERWQCETCSGVREDGDHYCRSCRMYWDDCDNGLWDA